MSPLPPKQSLIASLQEIISKGLTLDNRKCKKKMLQSELGLEEEGHNSFATRIVLELLAVVPVLAQGPLSHLTETSNSEQQSCNKDE